MSTDEPTAASEGGGRRAHAQVARAVMYADALRSDDLRTRAMAEILGAVTLLAPARSVVFYSVDEQLQKYTVNPVVVMFDRPDLPDFDQGTRRYLDRYAAHDPFAPSRWARTNVTIATARDVGVRRSSYASELAARYSVVPVANVYFRSGGTIVGGVCILRDPEADELSPSELSALRRVHSLFEHYYILTEQVDSQADDTDPSGYSRLTAREREIARLLSQGASYGRIGRELQISPGTVKTHVRHVYAKLGVANRVELMLLTLRHRTGASDEPE